MLQLWADRAAVTFTFACLAGAGFFWAQAVNAGVACALWRTPAALTEARSRPARPEEARGELADAQAFLERNLFGALRDPASVGPGAASSITPADLSTTETSTGACVDGAASGRLVSTWVDARHPRDSVAVIVHADDVFAVRVEDTWAGGRLLWVGAGVAYVAREGGCERLTFGGPREIEVAAALGSAAAEVSRPPGAVAVLERAAVDAAMSDLSALSRAARFVPSWVDGKANGFRVFSVAPTGLVAQLGLRHGDVVQRVNGHELDSPARALEMYEALKAAPALTVDVLRAGRPTTLEVRIR